VTFNCYFERDARGIIVTTCKLKCAHTGRIHQPACQKQQRVHCFDLLGGGNTHARPARAALRISDATYFTAHASECSLQPRVAVALVFTHHAILYDVRCSQHSLTSLRHTALAPQSALLPYGEHGHTSSRSCGITRLLWPMPSAPCPFLCPCTYLQSKTQQKQIARCVPGVC
jgi:hypothetical protein